MRGSILSQLRTTLKCMSTSNELLEQAVQLLTNDNLDLGCAPIEQVSMEKVRLSFYVFIIAILTMLHLH